MSNYYRFAFGCEMACYQWPRPLLTLLVCASVVAASLALVPPDCPIRQTCTGQALGDFGTGNTLEQHLEDLSQRYCGCQHVIGNVQVVLTGLSGSLDEQDFDFLYNLKAISGVLRLQGVPSLDRLTLPSLVLVRSSASQNLSLIVADTRIGSLNLPSLREITNGGVLFSNVHGMCNFLTVNWNEILDDPSGYLYYDDSVCGFTDSPNPGLDLPNCGSCQEKPNCWSSEPELYCQPFSKTVCDCGTDRCYPVGEGSAVQCCNPLCSAGCVGPTADKCNACKHFDNNGTCVSQCPPREIYNIETFQVEPNPDFRLAVGLLCVVECPDGFLEHSSSCVLECPENFFLEAGKCLLCDGPCPTECLGGEVTQDYLDSFRDCVVVTTHLLISPLIGINPDRFEVLSSVREIKGYLRIQGWEDESFPYLRNLRIVGSEDGEKVESSCDGGPDKYNYSLLIVGTDLQRIELSSLEFIRGGGYVQAGNPDLCYVGDLGVYLESSSLHECFGSAGAPLKNRTQCEADGFTCHPQCNASLACWGPNNTQCVKCVNFRYQGTCVKNCSEIQLPSTCNSSGVYSNLVTMECEKCDVECVGGCYGMQPTQCVECRNLVLKERVEGREEKLCLSECLPGTFLNNSAHECVSCADGCEKVCGGPLPYVDPNGCEACNLIQLDRLDNQVRCVRHECPSGTYLDILSAPSGVLPSGKSVCRPCHEYCALCYGPSPMECPQCVYARRGSECVASYNASTELPNPSVTDTLAASPIHTPLPGNNTVLIVVGTVSTAVVIALSLVCILVPLYIYCRKHKRQLTFSPPSPLPRSAVSYHTKTSLSHLPLIPLKSNFHQRMSKMLIPGPKITLLDSVGQGEFGIVFRASVAGWGEFTSPVTVAAKTLKDDSNLKAFGDVLEESIKMKPFDHPNVLGLIGVCLELGPTPYIVTKYMSNGSLLNFLKKERHKLTITISNNPDLVTDIQVKLLPICLQIAKGMEYLADKKFVHRDLAARNCMIDEKYNIKVADFGLSEDVYTKNYFRQDKFDNSVKLPFKWMALESLHDGIFTEKTDMWSYGVTCWEVFTCGKIPYPAMDPPTLLKYLEAGNRLNKPKNEACSDEIYNLMVKCWMDDPVDRPTFTEIVKNMEHMLENISGYLQLSDLMAKACVPSIKETDMEAQENSHYEHDSTA